MILSCDCGFDSYDWYYEISDAEYIAATPFTCYGCCRSFPLCTEVRHITEFAYDDDGEETNHKYRGRLCLECGGLYDSLKDLGFCLEADNGFITDAMREYRENYR